MFERDAPKKHCHPERAPLLRESKDPGEPREALRFLQRNNRAFGSLPY
jgi:hypothetical protein